VCISKVTGLFVSLLLSTFTVRWSQTIRCDVVPLIFFPEFIINRWIKISSPSLFFNAINGGLCHAVLLCNASQWKGVDVHKDEWEEYGRAGWGVHPRYSFTNQSTIVIAGTRFPLVKGRKIKFVAFRFGVSGLRGWWCDVAHATYTHTHWHTHTEMHKHQHTSEYKKPSLLFLAVFPIIMGGTGIDLQVHSYYYSPQCNRLKDRQASLEAKATYHRPCVIW